jgi:hypothetical protein
LGGKEICILVNTRLEPVGKEEGGALSPEFIRTLATFVQDRHALLIFTGDRVEPEPYNRLLFEQLSLLPYRIGKVETRPADKPWLLDRAGTGSFARFRGEEGYASLDRVEVRRRLPLLEPTSNEEKKQLLGESSVLMRYRDGAAVIARRQRAGQGEVMLFTTSVHDPAWSDLFIAPAFVPVVQVALQQLLEGQPGVFNVVAGRGIQWQVPHGEVEQPFDLVGPDGNRQRLGYPVNVDGRPILTASEVDRAGVYRIVAAGREISDDTPLFAVTADLAETDDLTMLQPAQIDERLGFSANHLVASEDGTVFSGSQRAKREWTGWLLLLLFVLVLAELALAWWCGRAW